MESASQESATNRTCAFHFGRYPSLYHELTDPQVTFIEKYAFHSQVGDFNTLDDLWEQSATVFNHVVPFPLLVQRVDSYMRQSRYKDTFRLIGDSFQADRQTSAFQPYEKDILSLIKAYCGLHVYGALRYAIQEATRVAKWLSNIERAFRCDFEAHAVEYWLHIMKYAIANSSYADTISLACPTYSNNESATRTDDVAVDDETFEWIGLAEHWQNLLSSQKLFAALSLAKIVVNLVSRTWLVDRYEQLLTIASPRDWESNTFLSMLRLHTLIAGVRASTLPESISPTSTEEDALDREIHRLIELARTPLPRLQLELAYIKKTWLGESPNASHVHAFWAEVNGLAQSNKDYAIAADTLFRSGPDQQEPTNIATLFQRLDETYVQMGDGPGMLEARCSSYRPQDIENSLGLLEWFSRFDAEHPLSQTLVTGVLSSGPEETEWDEPKSRYREEEVRWIVLSALTAPNSRQISAVRWSQISSVGEFMQPQTLLARSQYQQGSLRPFLPWKFTQSKNLSGHRFYNLCVTRIAGISIPVQNLTNHIVGRCNAGDHSESFTALLDELKLTNVTSSDTATTARDIQRQLFGSAQPVEISQLKLNAIQKWIETRTDSSNCATEDLMLQLKLQAVIHARQIGCGPLECVPFESAFLKCLEKINDPELKKLYGRSQLLNEQLAIDTALFKGDQRQLLPIIRFAYMELLKRYKDTFLGTDIAKVAILYGRLAEVTVQLHDTPTWMEESRGFIEQSDALFSTVRSNLIISDIVQTFELQSNVKSSLLGQVTCHKRNISAYVRLCLSSASDGLALGSKQRNEVLIQLWEVLQQGKARALLEQITNKEPGRLLEKVESMADVRRSEHKFLSDASTQHQHPDVIQEWIKTRGRLSTLRMINPHNAVAVAQARADVIEVESQIRGDSSLSAIFAVLTPQSVSLHDYSKLIQETGETVVLVDWFVADIPDGQDILFALTVRIESSGSPVLDLHLIGSNIESLINGWVSSHITHATEIPQDDAWEDLRQLNPLVSFLDRMLRYGEMLIFCPTSIHGVDRIPLHALSLTSKAEDILLCRSKIIYTYNHSLLADALRLQDQSPGAVPSRSHLIVSPTANHEMPPPKGKNMDSRGYAKACEKLSTLSSPPAMTLTSKQATRLNLLENATGATSLLFAGFVHGSHDGDPLKTHLMLYDPEICPPCPLSGHIDAENRILSAADIVASLRLARGAQVTLLACDSGVSGAMSPDEPLGLVAAMMLAGAGSTISTLWKIDTGTARQWMDDFVLQWRLYKQQAQKIKASNSSSSSTTVARQWMDIAEISRKVSLKIRGRNPARVQDWAPYVFHGRWRIPPL